MLLGWSIGVFGSQCSFFLSFSHFLPLGSAVYASVFTVCRGLYCMYPF